MEYIKQSSDEVDIRGPESKYDSRKINSYPSKVKTRPFFTILLFSGVFTVIRVPMLSCVCVVLCRCCLVFVLSCVGVVLCRCCLVFVVSCVGVVLCRCCLVFVVSCVGVVLCRCCPLSMFVLSVFVLCRGCRVQNGVAETQPQSCRNTSCLGCGIALIYANKDQHWIFLLCVPHPHSNTFRCKSNSIVYVMPSEWCRSASCI